MHTVAFQWVNPTETDYWEDLSIVGRIILIHILREYEDMDRIHMTHKKGQVVSSCERRNKSSVSITCREFHE
jgi:hypothetical protein